MRGDNVLFLYPVLDDYARAGSREDMVEAESELRGGNGALSFSEAETNSDAPTSTVLKIFTSFAHPLFHIRARNGRVSETGEYVTRRSSGCDA